MIERLMVNLWEAERDRAQFLAAYDLVDVRQMSDSEFEKWQVQYKRHYEAVYTADLNYRLAVYGKNR